MVEHGQETIPGQALQVLLSDPSRKKTRSDANADDKELYVSALPRSAQPEDIRKLFESHGQVEAFRMPTYPDGKYKGIAFIDYSTPLEAQVAIGKLNGYRLSGKEIKVSLVDKNRSGQNNPKIFKGKAAEEKSRSLRVLGLPHDAKEPLIQQLFESLTDGTGSVSKVQWTEGPEGRGEAVVEFSDAAVSVNLEFCFFDVVNLSHQNLFLCFFPPFPLLLLSDRRKSSFTPFDLLRIFHFETLLFGQLQPRSCS